MKQRSVGEDLERNAFIGVDVGGTHTDVTVILGDRVERSKALTTSDDFSRGLFEAGEIVAGKLGMSLSDLLRRTKLLINGTTVVTNSIAEFRGSTVGVLVTAGFRDTFRIAGGPRLVEVDDHLQVNVRDLVPRDAIVEVEERIDYAGKVLIPLDPAKLTADVERLVEDLRVDAIAICFLSSFSNPSNELEAEAEIRRLYPDLFVTPSHRVFPVRGENRRWTTAVLNSFVQKGAEVYVDSLSGKLRKTGLRGGLVFFQGLGGGISAEKAKEYPLALLGSGPAGGAIGANELAKRLGFSHVLLGDMGGTSFDTGIIHSNEIHIRKNLDLGHFATGVNLVDVVSVGAGGGSIVWVGERGVPQVGPRSAGSMPGPACYGQGGSEPTVTDAMVSMGFIDPRRYLAGRVPLYKDLAEASLNRVLGQRFGWSTHEAAAAVHDLVIMNMATALREISVEKGHDPAEFAFFAYGGMLPLFSVQIAARLGISAVVIPRNSSVFCALGMLSADFVLRYNQTVNWDLGDPTGVERINDMAAKMTEIAVADMQAQGFADESIEVQRSADFRFAGQFYELTMPLPGRPLRSEDASALARDFFELYERTYGEGTAWRGVRAMMLNYTITVLGRQAHPPFSPAARRPTSPEQMLMTEREVYLPGEHSVVSIPVYDDSRFNPGSRLEGPAIIDAADTTIYVPSNTTVERDEYHNYLLTRATNSKRQELPGKSPVGIPRNVARSRHQTADGER